MCFGSRLSAVQNPELNFAGSYGLSSTTARAFFFFQAEDGIRDGRVTGVQTCALPISEGADAPLDLSRGAADNRRDGSDGQGSGRCSETLRERSEERRVGKECRYRWWP